MVHIMISMVFITLQMLGTHTHENEVSSSMKSSDGKSSKSSHPSGCSLRSILQNLSPSTTSENRENEKAEKVSEKTTGAQVWMFVHPLDPRTPNPRTPELPLYSCIQVIQIWGYTKIISSKSGFLNPPPSVTPRKMTNHLMILSTTIYKNPLINQ